MSIMEMEIKEILSGEIMEILILDEFSKLYLLGGKKIRLEIS